MKRDKMPTEQRAKQFMPFAAVTGLEAALRMKEEEMGLIDRPELSEESMAVIDEVLSQLNRGDRIRAVCYDEGRVLTWEGIVRKIDPIDGKIIMEETEDTPNQIEISELLSISIL